MRPPDSDSDELPPDPVARHFITAHANHSMSEMKVCAILFISLVVMIAV